MLKNAALLCLLSFACQLVPDSVVLAAPITGKTTAAEAQTVIPIGPDGMPLDTSWEVRYVNDSRTTIENNV